ncbi:hypothetical protein MCEMRE203_00534 [Candidatus Nanopelagicaceae bacterium]
MYKFAIFLFLTSFLAISISRKVRISPRYERNSKGSIAKKNSPLDPWRAMDQGIDPTDGRNTEGST